VADPTILQNTALCSIVNKNTIHILAEHMRSECWYKGGLVQSVIYHLVVSNPIVWNHPDYNRIL